MDIGEAFSLADRVKPGLEEPDEKARTHRLADAARGWSTSGRARQRRYHALPIRRISKSIRPQRSRLPFSLCCQLVYWVISSETFSNLAVPHPPLHDPQIVTSGRSAAGIYDLRMRLVVAKHVPQDTSARSSSPISSCTRLVRLDAGTEAFARRTRTSVAAAPAIPHIASQTLISTADSVQL